LRIGSAALLIPLAIGITYVGGWLFALFWVAAGLLTLAEWITVVSSANLGNPTGHRIWLAMGVLYSAAVAAPAIILRSDEQLGFIAIIFLFAIVWATDTAAYLIGRRVGGPKLAPPVSPSKTWSGASSGLVAGMLAAALVAKATALSPGALVMLGVILSVCAQAGDLFESWVKRRFGAKDSGHLIPGHGGLMDRLDGFMAAALVAALIGVLRGGIEAPGRGLLIW
jgi:phosphatidate cytidylyltransferase